MPIKLLALLYIGCGTTSLIGCTPAVTDQQLLTDITDNQQITTLNCDGFASIHTDVGDLQNNIWNAHSAADFEWTQCLAERVVDGNSQYGWYWQWPQDGTKVYAQPQITLGQTPWLEHETAYAGYPVEIAALQQLNMDYDVEIITQGELNLSSTLWLTTSPTILSQVDKSTIAVEMMIWSYSSAGFYANPAGTKVAEMTASGIHWEVWLNKSWHDTSGLNDNNWTYLAFRATTPTTKAHFDIAELLRYSIEQQLIPEGLYIADIQLGNEVMSGTGQAWLKHFSVDIR
ncbi:glycoside hydrolase family 12 [Alteromonadaceae bacterium BrNp21-10]|nr:glycoside hydrolase family 12 [Alteromonadaceae bacterium BrNp21-10]